MKVIILNGSGGVGKDTFAKYIADYIHFRKGNYVHTSIIRPIKKIVRNTNLFSASKDEKYRKFLSDLKELTEQYCDYPFKCLKEDFEYCYNKGHDDLFIVDIREPKDIKRFVTELTDKYNLDKKDIRTVLITNPNVEPVTSNIADAGVDGYEYDDVITNSWGKETLRSKAHKFIIDFMY